MITPQMMEEMAEEEEKEQESKRKKTSQSPEVAEGAEGTSEILDEGSDNDYDDLVSKLLTSPHLQLLY